MNKCSKKSSVVWNNNKKKAIETIDLFLYFYFWSVTNVYVNIVERQMSGSYKFA